MLKVRLQRVGKKHEPVFRVVVTDSHAGPKAGKAVEILGLYDPRFNKVELKKDRISHWMGVGAQVSPTVHNLLVSEKVVTGKKINVLPKKTALKKEGSDAPEAPVAEKAEASTEAPQAEEAAPQTQADEAPVAEAETAPAQETETAPLVEEAKTAEDNNSPEEKAKEKAEEATVADENNTDEEKTAA